MSISNDSISTEKVESRGRGFASMDRARQRQISSQGGKAAHQKGTAHEFDSKEAREAGRKGGMVSGGRRRTREGTPEVTASGAAEQPTPAGQPGGSPTKEADSGHPA
jgi:general stress protein YciG